MLVPNLMIFPTDFSSGLEKGAVPWQNMKKDLKLFEQTDEFLLTWM